MEKIALLIVDDDGDVRRAARLALMAIAETREAANLEEMDAQLGGKPIDAVLLDMNFSRGVRSGQDGLDGLTRIRDADSTLSVVLMTASLIGHLGSSTFRLSTKAVFDIAHGLALLFGIGTKALPAWGSRTKWNNLWGGLVGRLTPAGPSGHTNSLHPSSREGHHSTAWWSSSFLLLH